MYELSANSAPGVRATTSVCASFERPSIPNTGTLYSNVVEVSASCKNVPASWPSSVNVKLAFVVAYCT
jgi:hypothetical protein